MSHYPDEFEDPFDAGGNGLPDYSTGITLPSAGLGDELTDKLLLVRPLGATTIGEGPDERSATLARVVEVVDDDDTDRLYVDHGDVPIAWQHVQAELAKASPEAPWMVGTIVKRTRAYFLNPPSPADAAIARRTLKQFVADLRP